MMRMETEFVIHWMKPMAIASWEPFVQVVILATIMLIPFMMKTAIAWQILVLYQWQEAA